MLLLLICFISTSVFAGEHKANSPSDTQFMDRAGNTSNLCVGVGGKVAKTCNKESSMHQGAMNSLRPQKPGSKKPSHESTFGDGDGKHEVWTNGNATSIQKPGSKKPTCSLHDSVHC